MDNPYEPPQAPPQPPPHLAPLPTGEPAHPTSLTVFGVLNVVFGGLGVLCTPFSFVSLFAPQPPGAPANPMLELMKSENYRAILIGFGLIGWVASGFLLAAGIGLLNDKPWARKLCIGYAAYAVVQAFVGAAVNLVFLVQPLREMAKQNNSPEMNLAVVTAVATTAGGILGLIYPALLAFFMTRPRNVAYLERKRPQEPDDFRMTRV